MQIYFNIFFPLLVQAVPLSVLYYQFSFLKYHEAELHFHFSSHRVLAGIMKQLPNQSASYLFNINLTGIQFNWHSTYRLIFVFLLLPTFFL